MDHSKTSSADAVRHRIFFTAVIFMVTLVMAWSNWAVGAAPPSLKTVPVPEPVNLADFVKDKAAAIQLGKALFWDMQVGSSGIQACASCHFNAGADTRARNQVSPGVLAGDNTFQLPGPNSTLALDDFPTTDFLFPDQPGAELDPANIFTRSVNDVISSQGVRLFNFVDILEGNFIELATPLPDPDGFSVGGINVRRVEPRNAPTVINAVYYYSNFWDGRARNIFNGVNPFGELDEAARVFENNNGLAAVKVSIPDASLASQAVGPPGSKFEMSSDNRPFPKIGKKLLALQPLARQIVHPADSMLGPIAAIPTGLTTTYAAMIQAAFQDKWWNNTSEIVTFTGGVPSFSPNPGGPLTTDEFTQMEANFSMFFGLAVQLYEATLVSDDSKFDQVQDGTAVFTPDEEAGLGIFLSGAGKCSVCHAGAEFTNHTVSFVRQGLAPVAPGFLPPSDIDAGAFNFVSPPDGLGDSLYDTGFFNIGVTPTFEDLGRGGTSPFINPLTGEPYPLSFSRLAMLKAEGLLPDAVAQFVPDLPAGVFPGDPVIADGEAKAPTLRNVELTGPYFHNGQAATLLQVVEFYTRGGNFPVTNGADLDGDIGPMGQLRGKPDKQVQLVAFLKTLTDERVRNESAPFDHPQLFIPNGSPGNELQLNCVGTPPANTHESFCDDFIVLPAVGAAGLSAQGLPPVGSFLGASVTRTFSISGVVTSGGVPLGGVTVRLTGARGATLFTNALGEYAFTGLSNGSYRVAASRTGFTFTPPSINVTINGADVPAQNFVANIAGFSISGRVINRAGAPAAGVTMILFGPVNKTMVTDAAGNYSFAGLPIGTYEIIPSRAADRFSPVSRDVRIRGANRAGVNFRGRQ